MFGSLGCISIESVYKKPLPSSILSCVHLAVKGFIFQTEKYSFQFLYLSPKAFIHSKKKISILPQLRPGRFLTFKTNFIT